MPLTLPGNTVAECLRTDCYILGDKKTLSLGYGLHHSTIPELAVNDSGRPRESSARADGKPVEI